MTWTCDQLQLTGNSEVSSVKSADRGYPLLGSRGLLAGTSERRLTNCRYICSSCGKRFSRPSSLRVSSCPLPLRYPLTLSYYGDD